SWVPPQGAGAPRNEGEVGQGEGSAGSAMPLPAATGQSAGTSADEWVWAPDGDGYLVAGPGERGHFGGLKGLAMIEQLVRTPGQPVPMTLLSGGTEGELDSDGRSKQPAMDRQALQATYKQMVALRAQIEQDESKGRALEAAEGRKELERLQGVLNA